MVPMTSRRPQRSGTTLVELTVALVLLLIVLSLGALAARRSISTVARVSLIESRATGIADALRTLSRHAVNADPRANDIRIARDSVLDLVHTIGLTTACKVRGDTLVITQADDSLPWRTTAPRGITADDAVRVWNEASQVWITRSIRVVASASGTCGDSAATWPGTASQRLILNDSLLEIRPGAIVRVLQRERWSLLRGADGLWSLSLATWDAASNRFDLPQPLLSALASPGSPFGRGFSVMATDSADHTLVDDSTLLRVRSIVAVLRSTRHALYGMRIDSVRINVGAH